MFLTIKVWIMEYTSLTNDVRRNSYSFFSLYLFVLPLQIEQEKAGDDSPKEHSTVPQEIPSQKDMELELLRKKKMELILKYASEDLQRSSENAKTLMGRSLNF